VLVKTKKQSLALPIGRAARIAFEIDTMRAACAQAAAVLLQAGSPDDAEVQECAELDEALARAHRLLKATVRKIMLARLNRRSRGAEEGQ
jgi:hypothetical protein